MFLGPMAWPMHIAVVFLGGLARSMHIRVHLMFLGLSMHINYEVHQFLN
jgi:hypothetical protein